MEISDDLNYQLHIEYGLLFEVFWDSIVILLYQLPFYTNKCQTI